MLRYGLEFLTYLMLFEHTANMPLPAAQQHLERFIENLESRAILLKVEIFNLGQHSIALHYFIFHLLPVVMSSPRKLSDLRTITDLGTT